MRALAPAALALAAAVSAAPALAESVSFTVAIDQPSIRDTSLNDTFVVKLDDAAVATQFELTCSAGSSALFGLVRSDETCQVAGSGSIKNPQNPAQSFPRVKYSGGFTVSADRDGYADAQSVKVSYLAVGQVPASNGAFGGGFTLLPENPSASALELSKALIGRIRQETTGTGGVTINEEIDSVSLDALATPSAGFPSDTGCTWSGNMLYAYATEAWVMDLSARCGDKTYVLQGNMPWVDVEGKDHTAEYVLNLTLPSAAAATDAGLFMTASSDNALFAAANGIAATFQIKQSGFVKVEIGETTDDVAQRIDATATLTGTGVPLDLVRSFAHVLAMLSRTMFGA